MRRVVLLALALSACADPDPRYGSITLTADAPSATLSGVTAGETPALELAAGCAGYVDPDAPDHVVVVRDPGKLAVRARSGRGPVALVIRHGDTFSCDSDDNTGHEPAVQLAAPGRYTIRVAALAPGEPLPYELWIEPDTKEERRNTEPEAGPAVSVTVTSEPAGASVRTPEGQVLGVTPAMFVLPEAPPDAGGPSFVLELSGHVTQTVSGTPVDGELVLHAALPVAGPRMLEATASDPQVIRDFQRATQTVELTDDCTIASLEADVSLRHSYIGDLLVQLRAPSGTVATLHRYRGAARHDLRQTYRSSDSRALGSLHGEQARGEWQLVVRDSAELDFGSLDSFTLRVECAGPGQTASAPSAPGPTPPRRRPRPIRDPDLLNPFATVY